ncbi:MAG TPA: putative metal-binding motif-containing protein, partial [Candidatus Goldiibacteriota bacterium]|nr:putative metal-binding motif-containing protein [Candidatus Goldiibacteriota bacterium]
YTGYVRNNNDCDDTDPAITYTLWLQDADSDGYANSSVRSVACVQPEGYISVSSSLGEDCDDENALINPGASEICGNGVDDNCDGVPDEGCE